MFAAFCAAVIAGTYPWSLVLSLPVAAALAWSRWYLGHHTPAELAAGALLGTAAGVYTIS